MLINKNLKHIHIHVPKTGGGSLTKMLPGYTTLNGSHSSLNALKHHPEILKSIGSYYVTTCIRNPWEHAVSAYINEASTKSIIQFKGNPFHYTNFSDIPLDEKLKLDLSFKRFLKTGFKIYIQDNYIAETTAKINEWFDFLNYKQMLNSLESRFNFKLNNIYREHDKRSRTTIINIDIHKPYQNFYDEEDYEYVKNTSPKTIKVFDYKF
jgi:hypothetical protein